jgi:hypothetical protein
VTRDPAIEANRLAARVAEGAVEGVVMGLKGHCVGGENFFDTLGPLTHITDRDA